MKIRLLPALRIFGTWLLLVLALGAAVAMAVNTAQAAIHVAPKQAPFVPGDWPTYGHDVSRTAYNPDETTVGTGNVSSLVQQWQVYIGEGTLPAYSGPSVADGKVYVASSAATGNNLFALDARTGALNWSADIGHGGDSCFSIGIGSTPAISGGVVAIGGGDLAYYGLDAATGARLWRHALDVGPSGFPWTSPLVQGGRVYVGIASDCDNPSVRGEVRALDLSSGNMLANRYFVPEGQAGAGIWNSPSLSPDGTTLVVATGEDFGGYNGPYNRAIVSLDSTNLNILQSGQQGVTSQDLDWATTPIFFHDASGRTLVGASHKNGTFYVYVLSNITAGPIWSKQMNTPTGSTAAYDPNMGAGGTLFVPASNGVVYALDPATGNQRWADMDLHAPGSLAAANGLLYINSGGSVFVLDERDGRAIRVLRPTGNLGAISGAVISNGFVYWTSGPNLNAWSLPTSATATPYPSRTPTPPVGTTPTAGGCSISFSDVGASEYFYSAVSYLYCHGAISGYADNTFRPYNNTTRGQLAKIVVLAEGWQINTAGGPHFIDVPADNPFYEYIETAYRYEAISGYADGTFRWGNDITRGQLSRVVTLAEGWPIDTANGPHFADVVSTDPFYAYIETAYNHGIISGYDDNTFRPGSPATRGQISKILYGAISLR